MKTKVQQPEKVSRTIQSKTKAANQASADRILQRYQAQTLQMAELDEDELLQGKFETAQREELDEDELLQGEGTAQLMELDEDEELPLQGKFETVQREVLEDEDELLQGKFETVQREALEEDELLQGKFEPVQQEEIEEDEILQGKFESTTQLQEGPNSPLGDKGVNNTGLPDNLKTGIENLSGFSMDDVRVHYNSDKPAQLQALAYAQGTDIHIAPGQEKHLPHEAWHVVQQKQGRVQPTMQLQGVNVNDNEGLEREADRMGKISYGNNSQVRKVSYNSNKSSSVIQGVFPATVGIIAGGLDLGLNLINLVKKIVKYCRGYKHYILPANTDFSFDKEGEATGYFDNGNLKNGKMSVEYNELTIPVGVNLQERSWISAISSEFTKIIISLAGLFAVSGIGINLRKDSLDSSQSGEEISVLEKIINVIDSATSILYANANVYPLIDQFYHFIKEKLNVDSLWGSVLGIIGSVAGGITGGFIGAGAGPAGIVAGAVAGMAVGGSVGKLIAPIAKPIVKWIGKGLGYVGRGLSYVGQGLAQVPAYIPNPFGFFRAR